ncbi:hypothetical protein [Streptomyces abyssomicinicus]|uniref:hypothetical protein n=1 Tax=Streptomyces abyssomicinicus TaxID=574929 RepID=UPI001FEAD9D3|nr:hypothetical protein [Streptomyces abyssomicinicus]
MPVKNEETPLPDHRAASPNLPLWIFGRDHEAAREGRTVSEHLSDEELARFLRESAEGTAREAPKEPSARARMVTARLREQEARGEVPQGWRTGPDLDRHRAHAARRRRLKAAVGGLVVAGLVVLALNPSLLPGYPYGGGGTDGTSVAAGTLPAETAAPSTAPGAAPGTPTLDDPFAGSPAAAWQEGAEGIVMPEPKAVGVFSEQQVGKALEDARTLLVDANVAPATLRGGKPKAALGVLDPRQPELLDHLRASLREPDGKHDPLDLFSRFDPEEIRVVGDQVRTRGRTVLEKGKDGAVSVKADYTFVYPVTRAGKESEEVTRAVVRRVVEFEMPDPARYVATPGKLMITSYRSEWGNSGCEFSDGWAHPQFDSDLSDGAPPSGPTVDPYDRSGAVSDGDECGTLSRV